MMKVGTVGNVRLKLQSTAARNLKDMGVRNRNENLCLNNRSIFVRNEGVWGISNHASATCVAIVVAVQRTMHLVEEC